MIILYISQGYESPIAFITSYEVAVGLGVSAYCKSLAYNYENYSIKKNTLGMQLQDAKSAVAKTESSNDYVQELIDNV